MTEQPPSPEWTACYAAGLRQGRAQAFREVAQSRRVEAEVAERIADTAELRAQETTGGV